MPAIDWVAWGLCVLGYTLIYWAYPGRKGPSSGRTTRALSVVGVLSLGLSVVLSTRTRGLLVGPTLVLTWAMVVASFWVLVGPIALRGMTRDRSQH